MPYPETAIGFAVKDTKKYHDFEKVEYPLKPFGDRDIDVAIDACGVCASDKHTISGGWGPLADTKNGCVVGHEVVGRAIKVGDSVKTIKVGDRVGIGAQVLACLECDNCKADQENYCPNKQSVDTYNAPYPDGTIAQGGFASHIRAHEYFTFKIPENIPDAIAAPMLCAGLTVYSPLVRLGCGPGKKVGIVGIGGLGHFAIMWAKALGAEVYAISHTPSKRDDALKMGATEFVDTTKENWNEKLKFKLDFIVSTSDKLDQMDLPSYFQTLKIMGKFHTVGLPDNPLPELKAFDFVGNGMYFGASHIGNRPEMLAMLELASKQQIKTWVQTIPISEQGCAQAIKALDENTVRYRTTLVDFDAAFGKRG